MLTWSKQPTGEYLSSCGRFTIYRNRRTARAGWVLVDRERQDACLPEYSRTANCNTVAHAKNTAERWARGGN